MKNSTLMVVLMAIREDEQEAGCSSRNKDDLVTAMDDDQTPAELTLADGGASTSRDYHESGESDGETPTEASGRARSQTEGQSDPENHTESIHETPKSHKRVRRPQMWKKNKLKDWATKRWKRIHFCPWQKGNSS